MDEAMLEALAAVGDDDCREIYTRIADLEVSVTGTADDDLQQLAEIHEQRFERTIEAYVEHRDDGALY